MQILVILRRMMTNGSLQMFIMNDMISIFSLEKSIFANTNNLIKVITLKIAI